MVKDPAAKTADSDRHRPHTDADHDRDDAPTGTTPTGSLVTSNPTSS